MVSKPGFEIMTFRTQPGPYAAAVRPACAQPSCLVSREHTGKARQGIQEANGDLLLGTVRAVAQLKPI